MSKVYLVTGVSRGIGSCIVKKLCSLESTKAVIGIARSQEKLEELKVFYKGKFDYWCGDVSDETTIENAVIFVKDKYKRLDGIVANAGVLDPVEDVNNIHVSQWKKLFDINYFSVVCLVGHALPLLKESHGNIVFVSSSASVETYYAWGAYGSSKAALNYFAKTIAFEEKQVSAISVAPGIVRTQMQEDIREKFGPKGMTKDALKQFVDLHENDQLVSPDVPASVYANLVSRGIPSEINGAYFDYNDEKLASFA
ncbi:hypothetical protein KLU848_0414 [Kluyveromyces marxianus]|nr:hypothetical protein C6P43_000889 [Kluyveromyces marxianus]